MAIRLPPPWRHITLLSPLRKEKGNGGLTRICFEAAPLVCLGLAMGVLCFYCPQVQGKRIFIMVPSEVALPHVWDVLGPVSWARSLGRVGLGPFQKP